MGVINSSLVIPARRPAGKLYPSFAIRAMSQTEQPADSSTPSDRGLQPEQRSDSDTSIECAIRPGQTTESQAPAEQESQVEQETGSQAPADQESQAEPAADSRTAAEQESHAGQAPDSRTPAEQQAQPKQAAGVRPEGDRGVITEIDYEFARQAFGEKRLTRDQLRECARRQRKLANVGIHRALPIISHQLGLLTRLQVEELLRHQIRRTGPIRIAQYALEKQIGHGGMGVVYRARQVTMDRIVAMKLLLRKDMGERFIERFRQEAQATAMLNHKNLVAALDVGESGGWNYFVMEYVDGPSLIELVYEYGALPERFCVRIIAQVASALAHAHETDIIHRDVKPGNIMVTRTGVAKLCDLGLAHLRYMDESSMYESGTTVGSRRYMSPEQVRGLEYIDARTDIYSLGLTLFFVLTGKVPFSDTAYESVMYAHLTDDLPWPADERPGLSNEVCKMVFRMSARDPNERFRTMKEVADCLQALLERL